MNATVFSAGCGAGRPVLVNCFAVLVTQVRVLSVADEPTAAGGGEASRTHILRRRGRKDAVGKKLSARAG